MEVERDAVDAAAVADVAHFEHGGHRGLEARVFLVERRQVAAHHHAHHDLGRHLVARDGAHVGSIAQDGDTVAQLVDFRHAVRDVDDRQAFAAELAHDVEQLLGFAR